VLRGLLILGIVFGASAGARAIELTLTARALAEAIDLGQTRVTALRTRAHAAYRVPVSRAPVDYLEVITPFRRVALAAEERGSSRRFGQRDALALLDAAPNRVDLIVELTFHPLNTYVAVPTYEVRLLAAGDARAAAIVPAALERIPRSGPRVEGMPQSLPFSGPLTGGKLIAQLDGAALVAGVYDVLVVEAGTEIARARVDFRGMR
jgi:hypothetical protein